VTVNTIGWNELFASNAQSLGLTENEAERVLLRSPIGDVGVRFKGLLAEIAQQNPARAEEIRRLIQVKMKEVEDLRE
jgi:hypothetical protein